LSVRILSIIDPVAAFSPATYVSVLFFLQEFIVQTILFAVCLYWQKALSKSSVKPATWKRVKKVGITIFVIWIMMLLAVFIVLAFNFLLAYSIFAIEVFAAQIIVIVLVVSSLRILRLLQRNPETKQASKNKVTRYH
jgi:heme/copper-type cytochrome/quinol oxidase subunit 2